MIKAKCISNRDELRSIEWPEQFVTIPSIGDKVRQLDGYKEAIVQSITHCMKKKIINEYNLLEGGEPYIEIYLEKKF